MARKKAKTKKPAKKSAPKSKPKKKVAKAKPRAKPKSAKKSAAKPKPRPRMPRGGADEAELVAYEPRGLGARSGGQSGDTQGLSAAPDVDSESVEELLEEGQSFEAEVLDGVENAPDPDQGELRTRELPEDDVPDEYKNPEQ
jgi:hypothetical protein